MDGLVTSLDAADLDHEPTCEAPCEAAGAGGGAVALPRGEAAGQGLPRGRACSKRSAMSLSSVCVYCASSRQAPAHYHEEARRLGGLLARRGLTVVCGGGGEGSMGALAEGVLAEGGRIVGIMPRFMIELEWVHRGLSELRVVETLQERKRLMQESADAVVALPGGSGTFEELLETITAKRLGLFTGPIVIVSSGGYYDPLLELLERSVAERFMAPRHRELWQAVATALEVLPALEAAPPWSADALTFARI